MGLLLSTPTTQPESLSTSTATDVALVNESASAEISKVSDEKSTADLVDNNTNTNTDKVIETVVDTEKVSDKAVDESGTKVEVVPVEVAETDDVVKKTKKRKNKNKH